MMATAIGSCEEGGRCVDGEGFVMVLKGEVEGGRGWPQELERREK